MNTVSHVRFRRRGLLGILAAAVMAACGASPTAPSDYAPFSTQDLQVGIGIQAITGSVVQVTGAPPTGTAKGSMAMIWQTVGYSFDSSKVFPGRAGLYRIVSGSTTADTSELVAPFSWNARFKYYTTMSRSGSTVDDSPKTAAPTDLNTVRGLQIYLAAEASDTVPGYDGPKKTPVATAVFFKNTRNQ